MWYVSWQDEQPSEEELPAGGEAPVLEQFRSAMETVNLIMNGYDHPVEPTVQKLLKHLSDPALFEGYLAEVRDMEIEP